jgi:hypothetical protein
VTSAISLTLGHNIGLPLIWHTLYKQSKNYLIYLQKYLFLNSYCTTFSSPLLLVHFRLFRLLHASSYISFVFFSADEKPSLSLKLVTEHAIGKHWT